MISTSFLKQNTKPIIYPILEVSSEIGALEAAEICGKNEIDYLFVKKNDVPVGVISVQSLIKNCPSLPEMTASDLASKDFCIINEDQINLLLCSDIKNRYILTFNDNRYTGIIDLAGSFSYYENLLNGTVSIVDSILNSCYNGIMALDNNKNVIVYNKSAAIISGAPQEAVLNKPLAEALPESPLNHFMFDTNSKIDHRCMINGIYIEANRTPILVDGAMVGGISVFHDITDSERQNQELSFVKDNEAYLESIIENSYDGIYITDCDGLTLKVNKSYGRITGIEPEKLVGKYMKALVEEKILSVHVTDMVVAEKKPVTLNQVVYNGKKVIITGSPIFDINGNVSKVITNVRDITELISLEKQLLISQQISSLYHKELFKDISSENIVCNSEKFKSALELAKRVSRKSSTVLILGDTGVGKEVVAKYVHSNSDRSGGNYIKINCGAIPENLLESELFGYVAGAFTGADTKGKMGLFELANDGTLFLDEIGELPLHLQSALLRVLQDGEITRIGDSKSRKVNVRIIAATNRNLEEMILKGTFRSDLFYRLNVISIHVPPLRERMEDIPDLAECFVEQLNKKYNEAKVITSSFINALLLRSWPGNVRELLNFIEKQFIMSDGDILDSFVANYQTGSDLSACHVHIDGLPPLSNAVKELEGILISRAIAQGGTTYKAAELLKVSQPTFFRKYKEYQEEHQIEETI